MTNTRRRRVRPIKKSRQRPAYKSKSRRSPSKKRSLRELLISILIGLILLANIVLIFYFVRHCAGTGSTQSVPEPVKPEPPPFRQLQIEVLNGCGTAGVANQFTNFLRSKGFDVVKTDNYEEEPGRSNFNVIETVVIDRRGDRKNAMRVISALGIDESMLLQEVNESYLIDATVIIGNNFRKVPAWNEMEN